MLSSSIVDDVGDTPALPNVIHTQDKSAHQGEFGVQVAQSSRRQSMSQDKQMLAEATITKLQEWLSQLQKDAPAEA